MVAAAMVGSAAVGVAGNLIGGSTQQGYALKGAAVEDPFKQTGYEATRSLEQLVDNPSTGLARMPGYQFTLDQGLKSTQNGFAARGLGTSGAALKGAAQYATGLANQTYGDQFNRLLGASNMGVQAGQVMSNDYNGAGNAGAGGIMGASNSISNGMNNYGSYSYMNNLLGQTGMGMYS